MADEVTPQKSDEVPQPTDETTHAADAPMDSVENPTNVPANDSKEDSTQAPATNQVDSSPLATNEIATDGAKEIDTGGNNDDSAMPAGTENGTTNGALDNLKKDKKRKSSGVPEHKSKKLNKKKSVPDLHLNVKPGEFWFARMRGHPPWPAVVCDEELLPPTLLEKRPVSAMRLDGSYREDFRDGGKNARDRRYPVMFLGTNEFAWQVNTDLLPLDMEDLKSQVERNDQGKKSVSLWNAYEVASEEHDLDYFKGVIRDAERARQEELQAQEEADAKEYAKQDKSRRKTKDNSGNDDVTMGEADDAVESKKAKPKKRKKEGESEGEGKPAKTPKTTKLKVNGPKTPKDEPSTKTKKTTKPKKAVKATEESDSPKPPEKPISEAERKEKTQKSVLYLRHRLQKGFLTRDTPPKEEEMPDMAEHFLNLENYADLEADIIKVTKIHKVLKAIIKLGSIPRDEQYKFKKRSQDLLSVWAKVLASDVETPTAATATATTNSAANGIKDDNTVTEKASPAQHSETPKVNGNVDGTESDDKSQREEKATQLDSEKSEHQDAPDVAASEIDQPRDESNIVA